MRTEEARIAGFPGKFLHLVKRLQLTNVLLHTLEIVIPEKCKKMPPFFRVFLAATHLKALPCCATARHSLRMFSLSRVGGPQIAVWAEIREDTASRPLWLNLRSIARMR